MPISKERAAAFQRLMHEAKHHTVALLEAIDKNTGEISYLICAVYDDKKTTSKDFVPICVMGEFEDLMDRHLPPSGLKRLSDDATEDN